MHNELSVSDLTQRALFQIHVRLCRYNKVVRTQLILGISNML